MSLECVCWSVHVHASRPLVWDRAEEWEEKGQERRVRVFSGSPYIPYPSSELQGACEKGGPLKVIV